MYLKFALAAALLAVLASAVLVLAANPSIIPGVVTDKNATGFQTSENVTVALAGEQLFFYANYTDADLDREENSTFKWYKRTMYQPQNKGIINGLEVML